MQLAPLQPLAPVVGIGVLLIGTGTVLPGGPYRGTRTTGGVLVGFAALLATLYVAFVGLGGMLESDPVLVPVVLFGVMGLLVLVAVTIRPHGKPKPKADATTRDDDENGGQRRPKPSPPPKRPEPSGPAAPPTPWDEFDDIRAGWSERVPAGSR